ncbi:MAG: hypothetical protein IJI92_02460 [Erysipelotrichaceae bacterium]|nr:hypothetical protein [Erysipelotrichaceae bacterium]
MGNIIRLNDSAPKEEWLSMSNQGTDCFLELLIAAASDKEMTSAQKALIDHLKECLEINTVAPGTTSFDIDEMPWNADSLAEDKAFMLEVISKARDPSSWKGMDYEPDGTIVVPWLECFASMINKKADLDRKI